jgi:succinate dehydrogenase / fumarate reductase flavoprotein subunit
VEKNVKRIQAFMDNSGNENVEDIAQDLKTTMMDNVGVFRTKEKMDAALIEIKLLQSRFKNAGIMDKGKRFNTDLLAAFETDHLLSFSEVVVVGGLARTESRGAHYRTDFAKRDDENWLKHTLATKVDEETLPELSYKSVNIDWDKYPPQERKY